MIFAQLLKALEKADLPPAAALSEALIADLSAGLRASGPAVALFDPEDRLVFASDAFAAAYGPSDGQPTFDAIMRRCWEAGSGPVIATADIDAWLKAANALRRVQPRRHFEVDLTDGRWFLASETICGAGWLLLTLADVTALKQSERKLRQARDAAIEAVKTENANLRAAEEKLQFANTLLTTQMETSPDGVLVVDAGSRIISFNQRYVEMWNVPQDLLDAKDDDALLAAVMSTVKDPQAFIDRVRHLYRHPEETGREEVETVDGRFMERHTTVLRTEAGQQLGRVWFFRDITDRKQAEAERLRTARFDALTGLANRAVFMEALRQAIAGVKRGAARCGVLYLDLDHFKDVNDTLGHPIGDELLKAVAARLRANVRQSDIVARFGGDEFAVLMADVGEPGDAAALADAIIKAIGAPFDIAGNDIRSGASIGIALLGADHPDAETILSRADVALYRAKSEREGGYRFHTDAMDSEMRMRVTLGAELREGIALGQLFVEYQPQICIANGRLTGVEALVRWRHPKRGVLAPELFIPIAEKSGLITALGHWVLCAACRQMRAWIDAGVAPNVMGVNVSAIQFKRPFELESEIAEILAHTGLAPERLELELTETTLMAASREHNGLLQRLRATGVRLAIDDFGVGYSSLDYLRRFPANRIKIAQVFVSQIANEPNSAAIVKATIGLARELGIDVIAEGVETPEQLALLRAWGCQEGQGYHFARPMRAEDVTLLLGLFSSRAQRATAGRGAA